jgi:cell surface protein SprA
VTTRYSANYEWRNAPPAYETLGNTIQNSRTIGVNSNLNFISLYNKSKFLKKVNRPPSRRPVKKDTDELEEDSKEEKKKKGEIGKTTRGVFKFLMMLKQAQVGVTLTDGTTLPGFNQSIDAIGQNFGSNAPGLPFIFGAQNEDFRNQIARNGFLTRDTNQIARYLSLNAIDINGSATIEPIKGFRISLSFNKRQSFSTNSNFRYLESEGTFEDLAYTEVGTFTTSFGSWATMFDKLEDDYSSEAFNQFKNNRYTVAQRLQVREFTGDGAYADTYANELNEIDSTTGFPKGFGNKHQEVLLHSFIAAYSGKNVVSAPLSAFRKIPVPNWRVSYNGLSQLDIFKNIFSNISISHGYSSTLNLGSFQRPPDYGTEVLDTGVDLSTEFRFQSGVSIIERLTPLIGIDVTTKEGLTVKFEYKIDRNLTLNVVNASMVEVRNKEIVIGGGFRTTGLRLPIKFAGKRIILQNDLNIRFDFSIRDGITVVRTLEGNSGEDSYIPTAGIRTMSIRPSIDYKINDALNLRMFYNRNSNNPVTSNSFPSALTDFGITIRYVLQ